MKKNLFMLLVFVLVASMLMSLSSFALEKIDKVDFDGVSEGTDAVDLSELNNMWEVNIYGTEFCYGYVEKGAGDEEYLALSGYVDISTYNLLSAPYTYSLDVQLEDTNFVNVKDAEYVAFFVRGVFPVQRFNPVYGGGQSMQFLYYETDWYQQNGGKDGPSLLGGSGIAVYPMQSALRVNIKTYVPDSLKMGNVYYDFPYPEGFDKTKFFNLKFVDDGEKVEIFIDEEILATVEMSEKGYYEDDEDDESDYFKKAVIKDKAGTEVLSTESARISAVGSQVAIGTRKNKVNVDNITIITYEPDPTPTPTPGPTPDKTQTPVPTTTPETKDPSSLSTTTIIIIVVAAVVIVGVGTIIIISKKNKAKK